MNPPENQQVEIPAEGVQLAAKVIARALRERVAEVTRGFNDRLTPNGVAEEALQAAAPSIRAEADRQVRWLLDRLRRLDTLADEYDARGRTRNGLIGSEQASADLRSVLEDARRYFDHSDTDVGVTARLDSIRGQATQQERKRIRAALEALERLGPEHDESSRQEYALGNDPIVMSPCEDGDYLDRAAALTSLNKETD
jgi:hypothetical protein